MVTRAGLVLKASNCSSGSVDDVTVDVVTVDVVVVDVVTTAIGQARIRTTISCRQTG